MVLAWMGNVRLDWNMMVKPKRSPTVFVGTWFLSEDIVLDDETLEW